jgi:hypothetical protein
MEGGIHEPRVSRKGRTIKPGGSDVASSEIKIEKSRTT